MIRHTWLPILVLSLCVALVSAAPDDKRGRAGKEAKQLSQDSSCNDVPAHPVDLILARPTADSVTISILAYKDMEGFVAYGTRSGNYTNKTPPQEYKKDRPVEQVLRSLKPDTRYYYRYHSRVGASAAFVAGPEYSFQTQRPPGGTFTFTVTADSHLDDRVNPDLYGRTLANALADKPDFHIDLGDTFMTEKHDSREAAARQYLAQRYYFGLLGHSVPLFLVLGNHDGEGGRGQNDTADSLSVWSNTMRKRYFPNPVPDRFYGGNSTPDRYAGLLQDYYAWEWGDALLVVLDPYWFASRQRGRDDNWTRTLGEAQYKWLAGTLERSRAKFKFVFIHNLVGGLDSQGRGGAEAAGLYEWGGRDTDGTDGFKAKRPGWAEPIHALLVRNRVSAVFHGHDHIFARQDLDSVVYQEVPQPGNLEAGTRRAAEYGYVNGAILGGSGYARVTVSPDKTHVDYVRSKLTKDATSQHPDGEVAYAYDLPAAAKEKGRRPTESRPTR